MTREETRPGIIDAPRLLLVSASDYQSAVMKGVVPLLADFDEGGFFERVLIAFPFARTSCQVNVSQRVVVRDIGTDWLPFGGRFRFVRRLAAPAHMMRSVAALVASVWRDGVHVVRATDPCFAGLLGWLTARLTSRPLCVSIHADWDKRHELGGTSSGATIFGFRAPAKAIERFVLRRAEMVMPIRESLRSYVLESGARPERIRIIPHGIDLQPFVQSGTLDIARHFGIPDGNQIISFAGRVVRENYVDDILELARRLGGVRQDFTLLMIGGGAEQSRLEAIVRTDPVLRNVVRLVGFQPRPIVAAVRQASSISLCLMGGYSLIEACAAGSPVVSYDVEWHRELVRDGETGFLVAEHDIPRLQAVVGELLDNRTRAVVLGKAARRLAVSRHDLEATSAIKRSCYMELLRGAID
jgi:glycosyltransferase involved in cell wall biosynthesis